jgi:hypothetical protein
MARDDSKGVMMSDDSKPVMSGDDSKGDSGPRFRFH